MCMGLLFHMRSSRVCFPSQLLLDVLNSLWNHIPRCNINLASTPQGEAYVGNPWRDENVVPRESVQQCHIEKPPCSLFIREDTQMLSAGWGDLLSWAKPADATCDLLCSVSWAEGHPAARWAALAKGSGIWAWGWETVVPRDPAQTFSTNDWFISTSGRLQFGICFLLSLIFMLKASSWYKG